MAGQSICHECLLCCCAGISELNLRQLPIELEDLHHASSSLPQLKILHLSGAQKLPPDAVAALLTAQNTQGVLHLAIQTKSRTSLSPLHIWLSR